MYSAGVLCFSSFQYPEGAFLRLGQVDDAAVSL
jgi:hypothetical protein